MNLTSHIQFVERMFGLCTEGPNGALNALFMGKPIPRAKWKLYMSFWQAVMWGVKKSIKKAVKELLEAWLGTHFFELLVDIFVWVTEVLLTLDTDLCKIEASRDPPLAFIPIPKFVESNGCARSDSLVRLLIF
jgi:hypothetical protein